jgi:hypothetical protein
MLKLTIWIRVLIVISALSLLYISYAVCEIIDHYSYGIHNITKFGKIVIFAYPVVALLGAVWIILGVRQRIKSP